MDKWVDYSQKMHKMLIFIYILFGNKKLEKFEIEKRENDKF